MNGKELKSGESTTISGTDTFDVNYYYEWWAPWQTYKGSGDYKYRIPANAKEVDITFTDWHNPSRLKVSNAELLDEKRAILDTKKNDKHSRKRHGK